MTTGRTINGWIIIAIVLAVVIIAGGVVIWSKCRQSQAIEISVENESVLSGKFMSVALSATPASTLWKSEIALRMCSRRREALPIMLT